MLPFAAPPKGGHFLWYVFRAAWGICPGVFWTAEAAAEAAKDEGAKGRERGERGGGGESFLGFAWSLLAW